jgi:Mrp family chromosome partitioning ATPase
MTILHAGRHVAQTLTDWLNPVRESLGAESGVFTRRGRQAVNAQLDVEISRREEVHLVRRLFLAPGPNARRTVLFAGAEEDNGCASICVRAGQILARLTAQSVCVVDVNVHAPVLHGLVKSDNRAGFMSAIGQPGGSARFARRWASDNVWIMPSGASSAADREQLLSPDQVGACLKELSAEFQRLIVCAPPINLHDESLTLSQLVDGVVLVLEANVTRREIARNAQTRLEELEVPLLGVVLNDRTYPIPEALYRLL